MGVALVVALLAAAAVAVVLLIGRPADPRRVVRVTGLAIVVLTAGLLTPFTVQDSGPAALHLLGVPVVAAVLALLVRRRTGDLLAGLVIGGWGLLLGLGIGAAFLPAALLYLAGAAVAGSASAASAG